MPIEDEFLTELPDNTFDYLNGLASQSSEKQTTVDGEGEEHGPTYGDDHDDPGQGDGNPAGNTPNPQKQAQKSNTASQSAEVEELSIIAKQWVDTGKLPKDFVIDETITEEKLDQALYDFKVKSLVEERVEKYIKEKGLTEEDVMKLKGQNLGIDATLYNKVKAYTELSKISFDELSDDNEQDVREYLSVYYKDLQIPAKKIQSNVEADLRSEDLDETLNEAKTHFSSRAKDFSKKIEDAEAQKIKEKDDRAKELLNKEKAMLQSKNIAGFKITEEQANFLTKALHEKTEVITLADGRNVKTSLYFKKIHEATSDPEKAFLHKIKFLLEEMPGDSPVEAASKGLLRNLASVINQKTNRTVSSGNIPMQEL